MRTALTRLLTYIDEHQQHLLSLVQALIRIPSENMPPRGTEAACQDYIAGVVRAAGYEPDIYSPDSVDRLALHPLATLNRTYPNRPNLAVRKVGKGKGKSLILSGHIDTVPKGDLPWTRAPFGGVIEAGRLYGRGANDMKAGVAINLFLLKAFAACKTEFAGDLIFESVVDEEFGGVNGTLAGRLRGYLADAAIVTEPSGLRICAGQRGGRTVHLTFSARGGILDQAPGGSIVEQLAHFISCIQSFATQRKACCPPHPLYQASVDPVPVTITKITTSPWGTSQPITVPEECRVELYWQLMPGEQQQQVDAEFLSWLEDMAASRADLFRVPPKVSFPIRWLPGSAIEASSALCVALARAAVSTLDRQPEIVGIEGPCDLFIFHDFGIPAVLWGPSGGNTHGSDEFVTVESVIAATRVLAAFICDWCGVADTTDA